MPFWCFLSAGDHSWRWAPLHSLHTLGDRGTEIKEKAVFLAQVLQPGLGSGRCVPRADAGGPEARQVLGRFSESESRDVPGLVVTETQRN